MADPKPSDIRPIASLTPRLLARKGGAKPAMRPQSGALAMNFDDFAHDDLGWNDMGHDHDLHPRGEVVSIDAAVRQPRDRATVNTAANADPGRLSVREKP